MATVWPHRSRLLRRAPRAAGQLITESTESTDGVAPQGAEKVRASGLFGTDITSDTRGSERRHIRTSPSVGRSWVRTTGRHQPAPHIEEILVDDPVRNHAVAVPATGRAVAVITGEDAMYNIAAIPFGDPAIEANAFGHAEYHVAALTEIETADLEGPVQHWSHDAEAPVRSDRRLLEPY